MLTRTRTFMRVAGLLAATLLAAAMLVGCAAPPSSPRPEDAPRRPTALPSPPAALATSTAPAAPAPPAVEADLPAAAPVVRDALARQLGVDPADLVVVGAEAMEWPDTCLGATKPGEMCAQVITPGFRLSFERDGGRYVVHSNADGGNYRLTEAPAPQTGAPILEWQGDPGTGTCLQVLFGTEAVAWGRCDESLRQQGNLNFGDRAGELEEFRQSWATFAAATEAGDVTLFGSGTAQATQAEARMVAEWAAMVSREIPSGRTSNANGLLLAVQQKGGAAALCSNVSVYLSGFAYVTDCSGERPAIYPALRLNSDQLAAIYAWDDQLLAFGAASEEAPSDSTEGKSATLFFGGRGAAEATEEQQASMEALAADLAASAFAGEPLPASPAASPAAADLSACAESSPEFALYVSDAFGYCLLVPTEWMPVEVDAAATAFTRGGALTNSWDARLDIRVETAHAATAQTAADARLAALADLAPGYVVERQAITLGGEDAVELRALPGRLLARVIYLSHNETLFTISLTPDDPMVEKHADMLALHETLLRTFALTR